LVAAGIFILLTAMKLAFPSLGDRLHARLAPAVSRSVDYRQAFTQLGESLSQPRQYISALYTRLTGEAWDASAREPETAPITPAAKYEPVHLADLLSESAAHIRERQPLPEPETEETPDAAEAVMDSAVETFLEEMAAFADYAIPANVEIQRPELPFAYASPIPGSRSSGFGYRMHPIADTVKFHYGTDIAANQGDDIYAFADGTVRTAGESDSYGLYLIIDHSGGYSTLYAHCSRLYVAAGDAVSLGDKIALVGATGQATGPHLHFELRAGEDFLNPDYYINPL